MGFFFLLFTSFSSSHLKNLILSSLQSSPFDQPLYNFRPIDESPELQDLGFLHSNMKKSVGPEY